MAKIAIVLAVVTMSGFAGYRMLDSDTDAPQAVSLGDPAQLEEAAPPSAAPPVPGSLGKTRSIIGQASGTVCSTSQGECIVPQAPINSYCTCTGTPGGIVR